VAGRVSQVVVEAALAPSTVAGRVSQVVVEVVHPLMRQAVISQVVVEVLREYVPAVSGPTLAQRLRHGMGLVNGVVYGAGSV
jgi:hypothetical protein